MVMEKCILFQFHFLKKIEEIYKDENKVNRKKNVWRNWSNIIRYYITETLGLLSHEIENILLTIDIRRLDKTYLFLIHNLP